MSNRAGFPFAQFTFRGGIHMPHFTIQELNLICIYDPGTRAGLIAEIIGMTQYLTPEETELKNLADSVVKKLRSMTDKEYTDLTRSTDFTFDEEDEHGG